MIGTLTRRGLMRFMHNSKSIAPQFIRESPVVHKKTWLQALKTKEKLLQQSELDKNNTTSSTTSTTGNSGIPGTFSSNGIVFAHNDVKTRDVTSRSTSDSFSSVLFPFKDDPWFLDGYVNSFGRLRVGQLFMDLDKLSGIIANKHCEPAEPVIVTASVDRILLLKRVEELENHNIVLWGYVSWTGRSSMEITINASSTTESLDQNPSLETCRQCETWLVAHFTFVARDPVTRKAFPINNLTPQTRQELQEFVTAEKYNHHKKTIAKNSSLNISPPSLEESKIIHELWMPKSLPHSKEIVKMQDTMVQSTGIMQPQYRNRHSFMIFGGYMMRQTYELAFACAAAFSHAPPNFVSLDTVTFKSPVAVGSVLHLSAFVVYTEPTEYKLTSVEGVTKCNHGTMVQVRVQSVVRKLVSDEKADAGTFIYSFFVEGDLKYKLVPESYNDMMFYLEGRRQAQQSKDYLDDYNAI